MACIILIAQPLAMATTELPRAIRYQDAAASEWIPVAENSPVRMSWVVVTDNDGAQRLLMHWASAVDRWFDL